jgi:hypothetical protein
MDIAQAFILDLGWIFFIAWGTVLVAVSVIAFGRDLFPASQSAHEPEPLPVQGD